MVISVSVVISSDWSASMVSFFSSSSSFCCSMVSWVGGIGAESDGVVTEVSKLDLRSVRKDIDLPSSFSAFKNSLAWAFGVPRKSIL